MSAPTIIPSSAVTIIPYPFSSQVRSLDQLLRTLISLNSNVLTIFQDSNLAINVKYAPNYVPDATMNSAIQSTINSFADSLLAKSITSLQTVSANNITVSGTTPTTSTTTGALQVTGGTGIQGGLQVGSAASFNSDVTILGMATNSNAPTLGQHLANKSYVDATVSVAGSGLTKTGNVISLKTSLPNVISIGSTTSAVTIPILSITNTNGALSVAGSTTISGALNVNGTTTFSQSLIMSGQRIQNVASPVIGSDAATRSYVDAVAQGMSIKASVDVATTVPLDLTTVSAGTVVDGVTLATNNRLLIKNQTNGVENGIYIVGATAPPTRSADMAVGSSAMGAFTFVNLGTTNASSGWINNNQGSAVVGTDSLSFSQFSAAGQIIAGPGIGKSGNQLFVVPDGTSIEISGTSFRIASGAVGTGLNGGGGVPISVNNTLPNVVGLGTITSGTWKASTISIAYGGTGATSLLANAVLVGNGTNPVSTNASFTFSSGVLTVPSINCTSVADSSSTGTGSLVLAGGLGMSKSLSVGGNVAVTGTSTFTGTVTVPTPVNATDAGRKDYIDGLSYLTAGTGLTKLTGTISINASQPTVTSLGTLSGLTSAGAVNVANTTPTTSTTTGALLVSGGVGIQGSITCGGNLYISGSTTFVSTVSVPNPVNTTDASNKSYTDGLTYLTAGTGLTKTGSTLSVNNSLTNVTSIGSLTALTVTGTSTLAGVTVTSLSSTGTVTVPATVNATDAARKDYVDAISYITAGTGLTKTGATLSVNASQTQITAVGTLTGITSSGVVNITNATVSSNSNTGALTITGGVGVGGSVNIGTNLAVTGTSTFTGAVTVPTPTATTSAVTKAYTDGLTYLTAGTGLTKTGTTLSVNAAQTQITSVGTLTGLTSSGVVAITNTTPSTSTTTGALTVSGGIGIVGNMYLGTNLAVIGTSTFTGTVTVPTPVNATDAGRKDYIDGISYITAGTGLTKTGSTFSVNASQTQITSLGTLTGITSSGAVSITNTTPATSTTTGALIVSGGTGIAGALYCGGVGNFSTDVSILGNVLLTNSLQLSTTTSATSLFNALRLRNIDATNVNTAISVSNSAATTSYTSRLALFTTGYGGATNTEQLMIDTTSTGGSIYWSTAGTGVARALTVYSNTVFNTNGTINQTATMDSNSATTGAITLGGGLGVAKSVFLGTNIYMGNSNLYMFGDAISGYGVRIRNIDATNTETRLSIANGAAASTYMSRFRLFSLGTTDVANNEYLELNASAAGAALNWNVNGTGTARALSVYNGALTVNAAGTIVSIGSGSTFTQANVTDSTSTTTGSITTAGGLGVAKNITATSGTIGNVTLTAFQTSAGWINMPTTGSSGLGTGGAGANAWIAYAAGAGNWFTNAAVGDVCYRNSSGRLLFGNTAGAASMALQSDNFGIGTVTPGAKLDVVGNVRINGTLTNLNTTDSTSATTGATILSGGLGVTGSISTAANLRVMGSTSGSVAINAPATVTAYTMTLPPALPTTANAILVMNTTGAVSYVSGGNTQYDGTVFRTGIVQYSVTTTTTSGTATCYPTSDGTATGTALFPNAILSASATAVSNTATATSVPWASLKSISTDRRTIVFNVIMGVSGSLANGGTAVTTQFVANGTTVMIFLTGY